VQDEIVVDAERSEAVTRAIEGDFCRNRMGRQGVTQVEEVTGFDAL
jgi:hypothetical protein